MLTWESIEHVVESNETYVFLSVVLNINANSTDHIDRPKPLIISIKHKVFKGRVFTQMLVMLEQLTEGYLSLIDLEYGKLQTQKTGKIQVLRTKAK